MKSQIIIVSLSILFAFKVHCSVLAANTYDACGSVTLSTTTGIILNELDYNGKNIDTCYIFKVDSMIITLKASGSCGSINVYTVTVNGIGNPYVTNYYYWNPRDLKLLSQPGHYIVHAMAGSRPVTFGFDVILNPVGIKENTVNSELITMFPNPTGHFITVSSVKSPMTSIILADVNLKSLEEFNIDSKMSVTIPLEKYPAGIYFIKVATLNQRTTIRKITIL